ncbi:hypothetical protein EMCRGX_G019253 [Ephydatia muelleri]
MHDEKDVPRDSVVPPVEAPPQTRRKDIQLLDDEDNYMPPPEAVQPMLDPGGGAPDPAAGRLPRPEAPRHQFPPRERRPTDFYGHKMHFGVLDYIRADVPTCDTPWGSKLPYLRVGADVWAYSWYFTVLYSSINNDVSISAQD